MQKITRMHVCRYGTATAWYDQTLLDFTAPDTHEAVNAIVNLENTGGKTSLLSYVFSIFEPRRDLFIQHMQNPNHQFNEYFAKDGKPSFIIIEWSMPSRLPGGKDYKLVIAQAVATRDVIERGNDLDRVFFAFESQHDITFEDIPAPGINPLGMPGVSTMAELNQWLTQMYRKCPEDFYHTRNQHDWTTHLATTRLLDLDLLVMQRQFNGQEGGLESGFLTFKDEEDLIRKLMALTMDPERAQTVRNTVVNVADKYQNKPRLEARLIQLAKILSSMKPLGESSKAFELALEARTGLLRRASGLAAAMELVRLSEEKQVTDFGDLIDTLNSRIVENQALLVHQRASTLSMRALQHTRRVDRTAAAFEEATAGKDAAQLRLRHLNGATSYKKITNAHEQVLIEERSLAEEVEGLRPIKETLERQGALLRGAIDILLKQNDDKRLAEKNVELAAAEAATQAKAHIKTLSLSIRALQQEEAKVGADIDNAEIQRNSLLDDGVLGAFDHDAAAAIERITAAIAQAQNRLDSLRAERTGHLQHVDLLREQAAQHGLRAQAEAHIRENLNREVGDARTLQEDLQQNRLLCSVVEAELCDPDSLTLLGTVYEFIQSMDREVLERDIRLANLERAKQSIEESELAGQSDDVDQVVRLLRTAGIHSARATNSYIANVVPNAEEARRLVDSDSARFLGVCVGSEEWEKSCKIVAGANLSLSAPVTVALATVDAAVAALDRVVISAEDDSAYNLEAAAAALVGFEQRIAEISGTRDAHIQRRNEARDAANKLKDYQERFGAVRIAELERSIQTHYEEEQAFTTLQAGCLEEAAEVLERAKGLDKEIDPIPSEIANQASRVQRLERYSHEYEQPLAQWKQQLATVQASLKKAEKESEALEQLIDSETEAINHSKQLQFDLAGSAQQLLSRKDLTEIFDPSFDYRTALESGFDLQALIKNYDSDKVVFDAEETERLGVRRVTLEQLRKAEATSREEYRLEFSDLREEAVINLLSLDLAHERTAQITQVGLYEQAFVSSSNAHAVASSEREAFFAKVDHPQPSDDVLSLSDDELAQQIVMVQDNTDQLEKALVSDQKEAEKALQGRAQSKKNVDVLNKHKKMLTSAVPHEAAAPEFIELEGDGEAQVMAVLDRYKQQSVGLEEARKLAQSHFDGFTDVVKSKAVQDVDPGLAHELSSNSFETTCSDFERLMMLIVERTDASKSELDGMLPDFENCVGEVHQLVEEGMSVLKKACQVMVPKGAPYVGGKVIMKMRHLITGVSTEAGKASIRHYLNTLIEAKVIPEHGADLVAAGMINLSPQRAFGLQLLQMEQNADHQYQDAGRLKKSGGQGVVIAMFMYLMMSQLRRTHQAVTKRGGGCPLILDNPFAKVQTRALIDVQIMLAEAIGVQLIFFTAMKDVNILAGFQRVIRLRKEGVKSGRSHIQMATATFNTAVQRAGAN
ncbi:hypothetical protein PSH74_10610 [Pseudomonas hefeiensis]|uniref:Uncharacterized protein n=1 Tax=Pseudomonas hefeiensis TaxID=2738125 RepID=A0ABY9GHR8_9PSED|nr:MULTISPECIES: hypothetical protein [unclassified Pseudomonas]WLH14728.1 hypothetical protein PSH57_10625 [Pseudomonas sp. FP205]WLI42057.1 hypothetical protein PSH74_10610 [Pseudomonas sp. FP821]